MKAYPRTIASGFVAALITTWLTAPSNAIAAEDAPAGAESRPNIIQDVELARGRILHGQVLASTGAPAPGIPVAAFCSGDIVSNTKTDGRGRFALRLDRGGLHEIRVRTHSSIWRVWMQGTAPPVARPAVLLVSDHTIVRGQAVAAGISATTATAAMAAGVGAYYVVTDVILEQKEAS
jgi:hypothetical protein